MVNYKREILPENYANTCICFLTVIRGNFIFQVLKMKMKSNMVSQVIDVYGDPDGTEAFGCSVATYVDGKLLIGTVTHQMVVCDSKYIM